METSKQSIQSRDQAPIRRRRSQRLSRYGYGVADLHAGPLTLTVTLTHKCTYTKTKTVVAEVVFSHTPMYPDAPPLLKARSVRGLSDADVASLQSTLDTQVEENMGMPMIYQLITAAQEWIAEKGNAMETRADDPEVAEKKRREAEEARIAEMRRHGTPVTPETFKEWKAKFDAEAAMARTSVQDPASTTSANAVVKGKLTGRAWFLQQEAHHIEIEEPELDDDEEDGEDDRSRWSGEDPTDYFGKEFVDGQDGSEEEGDFDDDDDDDEDDEMLNEYLNSAAATT